MLLTQLPLGVISEVVSLEAEGIKRRRLLDLGLIPGTQIIAKRRSPSGDPTAYLIRGTVIALRSEETNLIKVR
ncbi:ferrous iron transport protein A [Orenia metallireducens]|uniref:FeoA family protein n=1 Tax=Orenia metallireducens TaxID=1413210 RepID=UPI000D071B04|nr:FeoA family protein [Orenia metallireducens]PRX35524.1 ferrous iron transport protein A [Orenia metallireducens]